MAISHFHRLEFGPQFRTGQLELLDDVGHFFETVQIPVLFTLAMGYHEEGGAFEEQHLIGIDDIGEVR